MANPRLSSRASVPLDIQVRVVTIRVMEKDRFRSAIKVGMLACSILVLSALFIGCEVERHHTAQQLLSAAQLKCPHPFRATYYTHIMVSPHDTTDAMYVWSPPPSSTTGMPAAQPCPSDDVATSADSVKCTSCGAKLWP
jgi:hypothetical protein